MSAEGARLSSSAFIADLSPHEKSLPRFLLTLALGVVAFALAVVVGVFVSLGLLIGAAGWPAPTSLENLRALARRFLELASSDGHTLADALQILAVAIPDNLLPIFAWIGVAVLLQARSVKALLTSGPRFRWRLLLIGLALFSLVVGPFVGVTQWLDPHAAAPPVLTVSPDLFQRGLYALVCIAAFFPAALGEEMLFRGWWLRETSAVTRNVAALLVINGVFFAAAHLDFSPDGFLERAVLGAGFAYMTLRLGGIEFSTGAHLANNLMLVLFVQPLTLKAPAATGVTIDVLFENAFLFFAFILITEVTARWAPLRRWAGVDSGTARASIAVAEHFS
ncbi:MAG TPA: CPBP family intramembrane glutamic endopeptidase [Caulobacteraceae bacterium]|nr:CPBP family intramembrane glutamic endopeptidase [Caulobacteraceae bacterium]